MLNFWVLFAVLSHRIRNIFVHVVAQDDVLLHFHLVDLCLFYSIHNSFPHRKFYKFCESCLLCRCRGYGGLIRNQSETYKGFWVLVLMNQYSELSKLRPTAKTYSCFSDFSHCNFQFSLMIHIDPHFSNNFFISVLFLHNTTGQYSSGPT